MQVVTKAELESRKELYHRKLREAVFIYPTDTVYGVGCDAHNGLLVDKVRELKGRYEMPFSVIAPSKEWVREHCTVTAEAEEWLEKLPGPYTLILPIKKHEELPVGVTNGKETLGVRIPDHWITGLVHDLGTPIITTSANKTGENHMRDLDDLPPGWKEEVGYAIDEGEIAGTPSTIIDLSGDDITVKKR